MPNVMLGSVSCEWWSVGMKGWGIRKLACVMEQRVTWQPGEDFRVDIPQMDSTTYQRWRVCVPPFQIILSVCAFNLWADMSNSEGEYCAQCWYYICTPRVLCIFMLCWDLRPPTNPETNKQTSTKHNNKQVHNHTVEVRGSDTRGTEVD